jgi:hypothetical protein
MSSEGGTPSAQAVALPFVRPAVRQIIEGLFHEQSQWKSADLVDRVIQSHRARGGSIVPNPNFTIRRVLRDLRNDGLVIAPGHGWWRWADSPADGPNPEEHATDTIASVDDVIDDFEPIIRPDKEVGAGLECVYLYFNPNDRRLAELEGRDVWECKIGRTGRRDAIQRTLGQGIRTALSRLPAIGLVLRTEDSGALESALHSSLRLVGAEVPDSPGNEWFITSPARVEVWYGTFQNSLAAIKTSSAEASQQMANEPLPFRFRERQYFHSEALTAKIKATGVVAFSVVAATEEESLRR